MLSLLDGGSCPLKLFPRAELERDGEAFVVRRALFSRQSVFRNQFVKLGDFVDLN